MRHTLGPKRCLVAHVDERGEDLPACLWCSVCGSWINEWNIDEACDPVGEKMRRAVKRGLRRKTDESGAG